MKRTRMLVGTMRVVAASLLLAMIATPKTAHAEISGVGGKLGYSNPENLDGTAALGVHAEIEKRGTRLHLLPNVMYWSVDGVRDVSPNVDVYYHFNPEGRVTPYLGGGMGLNFVHNDRSDRSNTDLGLNLLGGLRFPGQSNHYFLEGRYTASDVSQVSVLTGVTFHAPY